ncbi:MULTISPECIES: sulfite exporter TauE/SafE family protein [unclassified Microbacterium]|uniref:sulfite exporter TauE/SafE family protein n=1 Tax=unclassified Microbacterium TaxID=2609290 RepID=UPI00386E2618
MSGESLILLALIVFVAACLQASIGFGLGMLAAPFIAIIDASLLPSVVIMLAVMVSAVIAVVERAALDLRGAGWALVGRIPGSILGAGLVAIVSTRVLGWLVAATVLFGVVVSLRGWMPRVTPATQIVAGGLSGVMGTSTSIGGAPMALIWQGSDGARLRGTMSAFFLVGSIVSMIALFALGQVTVPTLQVTGILAVPAAAGIVASRFAVRHLDRRRVRVVALTVSTVGAVLLIGTQVAGMLAG